MNEKSIIHYISKTMVDIMFYGGIICVIGVPLLAKAIRDYYGYGDSVLLPFILILFTSGLLSVYILFNLKQMFKTLLFGDPFVYKNVNYFRKMAVSCGLISLIYVIKCFYIFSFATLIIIIIFAIGCLFCLTVKDVFKQAVEYKEEHDLTI